MIGGMGIPARFANVQLTEVVEHDGNREALNYCRRIADGQAVSLLLWGPTGRGKTMLLTGLLNDVNRKWSGGHFLYWTMAEFQDRRRASIGGDHEDPILTAKKADLVVLDDLGVEQSTAYGLDGLNRLVDWRWGNRLPILVATNVLLGTAKEIRAFQDRYDPRILSRFHCDTARIVEVSGPNWRAEEARKPVVDVGWVPVSGLEGGRGTEMPDSVREILADLGGRAKAEGNVAIMVNLKGDGGRATAICFEEHGQRKKHHVAGVQKRGETCEAFVERVRRAYPNCEIHCRSAT